MAPKRSSLRSKRAQKAREMRQVVIQGYDEFLAKLDAEALAGDAIDAAFDSLGQFLVAEIKTMTPVNTGRLRRSINYKVESGFDGWTLRVGSDVQYAPFVEFGTGRMSDGPLPSASDHFPPPVALEKWAKRNGLPNGFVVARAIARRGGLIPRRMFRYTLEQHESRISQTLDHVAKAVEREWGS